MFLQLLSLDVYGNSVDGYEINNMFDTGNFFIIPDNYKSIDIIKMLRKAGILLPRYKFDIPYYWDECFMVENLGRPVIELKILDRQEFKEKINSRYLFVSFPNYENSRIFDKFGKRIK